MRFPSGVHCFVKINQRFCQVYDLDLLMPEGHLKLMDHLTTFAPGLTFFQIHFDNHESAVDDVAWIATRDRINVMQPEWSELCLQLRNCALLQNKPKLLGLQLLNVPKMDSKQLRAVCEFIRLHNEVLVIFSFLKQLYNYL